MTSRQHIAETAAARAERGCIGPRSRVLVVIVNYRTADLTVGCLRSLSKEVAALPGVGVVVVDNASGDASAEQITATIEAEGWGDWVSVMPLDRNGGFAFGNNAAIRRALVSNNPPDYVWLLNPDTIARPEALSVLVDFMEKHPDVGITGSRLENEDGTPQPSARRFPCVLSELEAGVRLGIVSRLLSRWIVALPPTDKQLPADWVPCISRKWISACGQSARNGRAGTSLEASLYT
jgi:N-acetylglucosaminyl-diphospho-decaprenol L-rhamnosyltransferase